MKPHNLQLKREPASQRPAVAWFIAGGNADAWLAELCRWPGSHTDFQLFIASGPGGKAHGLLVIPPPDAPTPAEARALALGAIEGKFYLPIDASLQPPVTAAETGALCTAAVTLLHPGIGLLEFEAGQVRRVWDLLERPELEAGDWNSARAGVTMDLQLKQITLSQLPNLNDIFGEASETIGSEPIKDLPARHKEPSTGPLSQIGRGLTKFVAGMASWFFSGAPKTASRRTWVNGVLDWAAARLAGVTQEIEDLRNKELLRLMDLLTTDPERGLRHALPLAGDLLGALGRGRTSPGTQLGARNTSFNLDRMGGGQPMDPWDVPHELRRKLTARYRELALAEQRAGRFRRAAYIYAELLGDLSSAAAALVEGRLYAEAAVLYRDHLRQPRVAAECFVEAGLLAEAITLYEQQGAFMEVAELHRKLGNEEAAAAAYRRVVETRIAALDFVGAAGVLEEKLSVPDEALALLGKGWPRSPQAQACLEAEFALLGRLGRHEPARRRLTVLRDEATPAASALPLARVLAKQFQCYPDLALRPVAADIARVKISARLLDGHADEIRAGSHLLSELAPEDRLLPRDASRFLAARLEALERKSPTPLNRPRKPGSGRALPPEFLRKFTLPKNTFLADAKRCGQHFVAALFQNQKLLILRGHWSGVYQALDWPEVQPGQIDLVLDAQTGRPDWVIPLPRNDLRRHYFNLPATGRFAQPLRVAVPLWFPSDAGALALYGSEWWILRGLTTEIVLELRDETGRILATTDLSNDINDSLFANEGLAPPCISMLALRSQVWIAVGRRLHLFNGRKAPHTWEFETECLGLGSSAPFLARAIVAACRQGAVVFWPENLEKSPETVGFDLESPTAAFLGNGLLVLLATGSGPDGHFAGQVIDLDRRGVLSAADFTWRGGQPAAVIATDVPNEFAIFTVTGETHIHRAPLAP